MRRFRHSLGALIEGLMHTSRFVLGMSVVVGVAILAANPGCSSSSGSGFATVPGPDSGLVVEPDGSLGMADGTTGADAHADSPIMLGGGGDSGVEASTTHDGGFNDAKVQHRRKDLLRGRRHSRCRAGQAHVHHLLAHRHGRRQQRVRRAPRRSGLPREQQHRERLRRQLQRPRGRGLLVYGGRDVKALLPRPRRARPRGRPCRLVRLELQGDGRLRAVGRRERAAVERNVPRRAAAVRR